MAVFIELTTDAFRDQFAKTTAGKKNARKQKSPYGRAGGLSVRRPLRGLEIKQDTFALIRMIQVDGNEIPMADSGSFDGTTTAYSNFILQAVQEARMEKHQIVETFGEPYIFFFGEAPRFLDVTAVLVNSNDFNWEAEWWFNYENYFRGTKSVELGARTYLFYDDNVVEGYMLQAQSVKVAEQPLSVSLTFRLFVTNYENISFIGDPSFPIRSTATVPDGIDLTQDLNGEQINALVAGARGIPGIIGPDGQFISSLPLDREFPIRSNITDNWDEWTGDPPIQQIDPFAEGEDLFAELEDLQLALLALADSFGVEQGGPGLIRSLGLQATFSGGIGIGFGAGASFGASATFGASAHGSAFVGGSAGVGFSASASAGASAFASANASFGFNGGSFNSFSGSSFGGSSFGGSGFNSGFGSSFGNDGFGSGFASSSYGGGVGAGASTYVGGYPSAFAMASVEGDLDITGNANAYASASIGA